jgi:hypothetical protein
MRINPEGLKTRCIFAECRRYFGRIQMQDGIERNGSGECMVREIQCGHVALKELDGKVSETVDVAGVPAPGEGQGSRNLSFTG